MQMSFEISRILRSRARSMASAFCRALVDSTADSSAVYDCEREAFGRRASGVALSWAAALEDNTDKASRAITIVTRVGALLKERIGGSKPGYRGGNLDPQPLGR